MFKEFSTYHEPDKAIIPDTEGSEMLKMSESAPLQKISALSQVHSVVSYEAIKSESKKCWLNLPDSVNGTLIYFLLVENNTRVFSAWEFIQCLIYVGFPVFFTFYLQGLLLYFLWLNVPPYQESDTLCPTSTYVQQAVISIFIIFLIPSVVSILRESLCILRSDRVAFEQEEDSEKMVLYKLVNTDLKRALTFAVVVIPETIILLTLFYVGSGFVLTSESIGDIIINSVAIAFIMDIDNFCVEAFQTEEVSERSDNAEFETSWDTDEAHFTEGEMVPLSNQVISTFSNFSKVIAVIVASGIYIYFVRTTFCSGNVSK
jgi:hypothetical protein